MEIYFAGSIRGAEADKSRFKRFIDHLSGHGKVLTEHSFDYDYAQEINLDETEVYECDMGWLEEADVLVVLDTATLNQLEEWGDVIASSDVPKVFIDHHSPHPETSSLASLYLVDEAASSTCEIVHQLYEGFGLTPSANVAKALLVGIAYDSRHFSLGTARTLRSVSRLLEIWDFLEEIISLLTLKRERSECMARLKAARERRGRFG